MLERDQVLLNCETISLRTVTLLSDKFHNLSFLLIKRDGCVRLPRWRLENVISGLFLGQSSVITGRNTEVVPHECFLILCNFLLDEGCSSFFELI